MSMLVLFCANAFSQEHTTYKLLHMAPLAVGKESLARTSPIEIKHLWKPLAMFKRLSNHFVNMQITTITGAV